MRKTLAMLLVLAMCLSIITACTGGNSGNAESGSSTADESGSAGPADAEVGVADEAEIDDGAGEISNADSGGADDTIYTITVQNHDSVINASTQMLLGWEKDVEEASSGRIDVIIYTGGVLGGPTAALDLLDSNSVDVAWGLMTFFQGSFINSEVISLPMLGVKNANQGSNALWELYRDYDLIKSDYENWKVLYLHTNTNSPLITNTKITSSDAIRGMNIRVTSGPIADLFTDLGATPVSTGISEIFTRLDNNTLDGSVQGWDVVNAFQLYEVTDYFLDDTLGCLGNFMLMTWDCYNSLPPDLQAVIDGYSGDYFLKYSAYLWKELELEARAGVDQFNGQCYTLDETTRADFQDAADNIISNWCDNTPNGQEIYDTAKALVDKYSYLE